MTAPTRGTIESARDAAQQMVTCLLHNDRPAALDIFDEFGHDTIVALVLADLCAYVHHRWAGALHLDRGETWRELMLDIAEWVEGIE